MTEYGRGPGSEPWHPEDPLYGDQGWGGRQADHGQSQYGDQQQSYPQDPYAQQHQNHQQHQSQNHQQYPQQQSYDQHQQYDPQQPHQQQYQHQYGAQQQDPYGQQPPAQPQYDGGWDSGQQAAVPYGAEPQDPYAQQQPGYGESHDYYGTPEAYPPPQPPGRREAPEQQQKPSTDWDPDEQREETHPFFTGADEPAAREPRDDDDDPDDDSSRSARRDRGDGERRGGKGKKKKSRNGCACLVVSLVLVGGLGGVSYVGYTYWKKQFGAPADFAGAGTSEQVEVEIPEGSFGYDIANILRKKGVIKSSDAFVAAQNDNPKGKSLQAGVYLLNKEMSAASAIELMLDPKSQNALVIPEGTRNVTVYAKVDARLGLKKGTTAEIAKTKAESLGLPGWADDNPDLKDPLEGFLYPAAYPVAKGSKPEDALKRMVTRANKEYDRLDLEAVAKKHKLDGPWQVVTVASLVQVEGKTHDDFRKMAEVVYNRLKPTNTETNQLLQFDSAFNYLNNQSNIKISESEILSNKDPYNTYTQKGLTPGPISNPGADALAAALNPTTEGWLYFVATDGKHKTEFAKTYDEHLKLKEKFDALG
ncbi:endolytic transglycosylase MltG [Streptomyces cyaneofuscatus]|uniref:endolytic transglycosylase MltG n=1 Tax=Streptomyces cyaneofuscatus TaxID=66883 RepID=UPI0029552AE6|nr:endolytic transglycosylase MltG [Streptomyces cyaneofuscatus]WOP12739.1 endolytic transglycosylase MltG [Streptomyces cyaneofuscatus]